MHRSRVCHFVIDVPDPDQGVAFWSAALGAVEEPLPEISSGIYRHLRLPDSDIRILLQKTNDPKVSKERMHLDLETDDVEAEVKRLEALGAKRWDRQQERGFDFWVMRDPWDNEFCVLQPEFPELLARREPWKNEQTTDQSAIGTTQQERERDETSERSQAMITADASSLEQCALAAAAKRDAAGAALLERQRQEEAQREAELEWRLRKEAADRLKETLGHPSSPADWDFTWKNYNIGEIDYSDRYLTTKVLEVEISVPLHVRETENGYEWYLEWDLNLAGFGNMLAKHKKQEPQG
jgi:predicted enzyme related to lactoylglutathione lyase